MHKRNNGWGVVVEVAVVGQWGVCTLKMLYPCKAFCICYAYYMRNCTRAMHWTGAMHNTRAMRLKRATSVKPAIRLSVQHVFHIQRVWRTPHTNGCSLLGEVFPNPFWRLSLQCCQKTSNVGASNVWTSNVIAPYSGVFIYYRQYTGLWYLY